MITKEFGSQIAKNGFKNEKEICSKFENWEKDLEAQEWLKTMQYNLDDVEHVKADFLHGSKADINVQVKIKLKTASNTENIQIKLVSNVKGYNQVDKRWLSKYKELWNIPNDVFELLQYFTGEKKPYKMSVKNNRMFLTEFSKHEQDILLNWFKSNRDLVASDVIKGRGQYAAEWILVAQNIQNNSRWILVNINTALQYYGFGEVSISNKGSLHIGRVTVQRKGGDGGRKTANMLQFKLNPAELFDLKL